MRRIGLVWCILVSALFFLFMLLTVDVSKPGPKTFMFALLQQVQPRGLSVFLGLLAVSLMLFLTAAVVCSAWNRIAPQILHGAKAMTFAEAYAVVLVFALVA